jgi:hypothetical protein
MPWSYVGITCKEMKHMLTANDNPKNHFAFPLAKRRLGLGIDGKDGTVAYDDLTYDDALAAFTRGEDAYRPAYPAREIASSVVIGSFAVSALLFGCLWGLGIINNDPCFTHTAHKCATTSTTN